MPLLPLLPSRLDMTATSESMVTSTRRRAIVQGALVYDELQIFDEDVQPFSIGTEGAEMWEVRGQLRSNYADATTRIEATFECGFIFEGDGSSLGKWFYRVAPADSAAIRASGGTLDFELVNLSDPRATVGDVFKLHRGKWSKIQETTA